ncbi:MAG TPA: DNA gyrase subunit B, partial [Anaerolineaceae bacterium]|nr:DNA gyrase subunit B [Anaerolineaceae bacterium]
MTTNNANISSYGAKDIQVLEGLEAVRRRPGMYVGGTDQKALHHLVYEVVDNSIDEALAGVCDRITVTIHPDSSITVEDNGRGIPVDVHPEKKKSALEVVMTTLHAGGKFGHSSYKVSGGLHGVGVSAVNALSEWCEVEVRRDGKVYFQRYERGIPQEAVKPIGKCDPRITGTRTTFHYDTQIFQGDVEFRFDTLATRFREMAFVTRQVQIRLVDERSSHETSFYFDGGIRSFVRYLNRNREVLHPVFYVEKEIENIGIEVSVQYTDGYNESVYSFANTINTVDGGTHLTGLRMALTRVINDYARKTGLLKEADPNFTGEDTREGLTALVSIKHPDPQFESQTKVKLMNPEVQTYVQQIVGEAFQSFLQENPQAARAIVQKNLTSARARDAARKARDLVIRKSALESLTLPGKLADCSERDSNKTEIYIVEGNSAGGSAKQGRDRHFQAILPLRGKILNTERARMDKLLGNEEIKSMISALGVGIGSSFDLSGLRYGRVIIMTDADVDGSHIRT